jgi:hypothetical protein
MAPVDPLLTPGVPPSGPNMVPTLVFPLHCTPVAAIPINPKDATKRNRDMVQALIVHEWRQASRIMIGPPRAIQESVDAQPMGGARKGRKKAAGSSASVVPAV